jgi:hypothetical protein
MGNIAAFECQYRSDATSWSKGWKEGGIFPAHSLRLNIGDNNLIVFEFNDGDTTLGTYPLCYSGFLQFGLQFKDWFFEDESKIITHSCVERSQPIRCLTHADYAVSFIIGIERPEIIFYADRSDVLKTFDCANRFVATLPERGCYRITEALFGTSPAEHSVFGHNIH